MHRIGLIVPSSNTTMETEVPSLLRDRERRAREHSSVLRPERVA